MSGRRRALVADVGGTHVRLALLGADGRPGPALALETRAFPGFGEALEEFRRRRELRGRLDAVAVCAAGPVRDGRVALTNCPWVLSEEGLREATGAPLVRIVNDFTAVALALPDLGAGALRPHRPGDRPVAGLAMAVLGPGTGLGVSGLVPGEGGGAPAALAGEGGHVTLAPGDARECEVIRRLAARYGHASAERALSGPGLANLYRALAEVDGIPDVAEPEPGRIARDAHAGHDPRAAEAVRMFTGLLGSVAGDLALTLGARGGVFVAGGIVPGWGPRFDAAAFRARFEAKGRLSSYLAAVPTLTVTDPCPALIGLARLVRPARARR